MNLLKRFKSTLLNGYINCETRLQNAPKEYKQAAGVGTAIGTVLYGGIIPMFAEPSTDIAGFGEQMWNIGSEVYKAIFPVVTIIAAILLVISLIVRMTGNQQKAAQATSWAIRIIICYICINCIGLLFSVINGTADKNNWGFDSEKYKP